MERKDFVQIIDGIAVRRDLYEQMKMQTEAVLSASREKKTKPRRRSRAQRRAAKKKRRQFKRQKSAKSSS